MPMHKSQLRKELKSKNHPSVKVGILDWYNSVVRMSSKDRSEIISLAAEIVEGWKSYSDLENDIIASTDGVPHNSCSPVVRMVGGEYGIDLILRNNRTSDEYPDGIFHAHPEYHNIKKEGIGLIEAMGLFILPGRLKKQLAMIAEILCGKAKYDEKALSDPENYLYVHRDMTKDLVSTVKTDDYDVALAAVTERVNVTCKNILGNTAVFKNTPKGNAGFERFLNSLDITEVM